MLIDNVIDAIISPETTNQPIPQAVMHATALIAYSAGNSWLTYGPYCRARPDLAAEGWIISTTLTCDASARMYDIESGGGHISNIGRFMKLADRRHGKPILYTFASGVQAMIDAAADQGYGRNDYFVISAHPNGRKHICGPHAYGQNQHCGYPEADGTQYVFTRDWDKSVLESYVLPAVKPSHHRGKGVAVAEIQFDLATMKTTIHPKPARGQIAWEQGDARWASQEIQLGLGGDIAGQWRHHSLPFDAPPLGRKK